MDYARTSGEGRRLAGHAVAEAHSQRDDEIRLRERAVGARASVHSRHPQRKRIVPVDRADAHHRRDHRNPRLA